MNRELNIIKGNSANEKIVNYLKTLKGFRDINEIKDGQQNRWSLQGMEKLQNDINMHLGIDYVLEMEDGTYYLDTKGFNYNSRYYGSLNDGIVETMLLQVEKCYGGQVYWGWANNPIHLTQYTLILVNGFVYCIDYARLVEYCARFNRENIPYEVFNKGYGNYEVCIKVPVAEMIERGVITFIDYIG